MRRIFKYYVICIISLFCLTGNVVLSVNLNDQVIGQITTGGQKAGITAALLPHDIITSIITVALGLIGSIFVVLIVLGGFYYLTSNGDEEKAKKGSGYVQSAVIGLVIVLISYAITIFVGSKIPQAINSTPTETQQYRAGAVDVRDWMK